MFEDDSEEQPDKRPLNGADRAKEKSDEFRMHAELAAIFEAVRKFDAEILTNLDAELARDVQKAIAKLEKAKMPESPVILESAMTDAARVLDLHREKKLSTNDYHIYRRPGEVMIVRWIEGDQVESFYKRLQAHFDAALNGFKEDERQAKEWKQEEETIAYLKALDGIKVNMAERYLREIIRELKIFVLSTQTADEVDILHLCDFLMGVPAAEVVGKQSAPGDEPTEAERAWFMKIFSLRGMKEETEQMCFFTYLQKAEDTFDFD